MPEARRGDTAMSESAAPSLARLREVFQAFLYLGCSAFGGPLAHLGYFRSEFVSRRGWLSEAAYAELVAFCQLLPGPTSSQAGFAIGMARAGLAGGLVAFAAFTLPSALLMLAIGLLGADWFASEAGRSLAHGLKLVAVSVVAHAVIGMGRNLVRDSAAACLAVFALFVSLLASSSWAAPLVIVLGGLLAMALNRAGPAAPAALPKLGPAAWIALAVLIAAALGPALALGGSPLLELMGVMARAGGLVFGGGHVVLPLLEAELVGARGLVDREAFLAGYGAAQALPGPLFSFSAFVGAAAGFGPIGALSALAAMFAPGLVLVWGFAPVWLTTAKPPLLTAFARGAGAAVAGVLAAALIDPLATSALESPIDVLIAGGGLAALLFRAPTLAVILAVAGAGGLACMLAN